MTTRCEVVPGDSIVVTNKCKITRDFDLEGVPYGPFVYDLPCKFEWEVRGFYRTKLDAMKACADTMEIKHVQKRNWI
jgi:hypothetical protein